MAIREEECAIHTSSFVSPWLFRRGLVFPKVISAFHKHLVVVVLVPPGIRAQARELPAAADVAVAHDPHAVSVALHRDGLARRVGVLLVRDPHLVGADDLVVGDLGPAAAADEVLRLEQRVTEELGVGGHGEEFVGGHGVPHLVEEGAVVDLAGNQVRFEGREWAGRRTYPQGRGDAFAETLPVLLWCQFWRASESMVHAENVPWCRSCRPTRIERFGSRGYLFPRQCSRRMRADTRYRLTLGSRVLRHHEN